MAETKVNDLADLKVATQTSDNKTDKSDNKSEATASDTPAPREPKKDSLGRSYGTGRRKDAVARVWVKPGSGKIIINGAEQAHYFKRKTQHSSAIFYG